jgi:AAA domain
VTLSREEMDAHARLLRQKAEQEVRQKERNANGVGDGPMGPEPPPADAPEWEQDKTTPHDATEQQQFERDEAKPSGRNRPHAPKLIRTVDAFPINEDAIPQRQWIVPGLLLRRCVTVLVAPSASGKSLLSLQAALACGVKLPWAGWHPRDRYGVLIINSEEDTDEMRRRLAAAVNTMEIDQAEILNRVILADDPDGIVIAKFDAKSKTLVRTPLVGELVETIKAKGIDIVIADPFAETFEGDENSNSELKWAAMLWREVARRTNTAVWLNHHTKKYASGMAGEADAARGASALIGICRILSTLFPMTKEEALILDVSEQERLRYIRYDDAKANLNLITRQARWFRKETYTINNATDETPGDQVGVLVPWKPDGLLDKVTNATINNILDEIEWGIRDVTTPTMLDDDPIASDYYTFSNTTRKNFKSRWVGQVVMRRLQCDEAKATKIINQWKASGLLFEIEYKRDGKDRKGVKVDPTKRPERETFFEEARTASTVVT